MKTKFAILLAACCFVLSPVKGSIVSVTDAQNVALNFFKLTAKVSISRTQLTTTLKYTRTEANGRVSLYVFDMSPLAGFVIVSASDLDQPIIAYSTESFFATNFSKTGVNDWISGWGQEIAYIEREQITARPGVAALWTCYRQGVAPPLQKSLGVGPLCTTTWNQSGSAGSLPPIYNEDCPYDINASTNALTGCVATAMAQIMKYWNYPPRGAGIASYDDETVNGFSNNYGLQTFNFNTTSFDWAGMPDYLTTGSSALQDSAISLLCYACGVSVSMDYGTGTSGAWTFTSESTDGASAQQAFPTYFKYNPNTIQAVMYNNYTTGGWIALIENELSEGRPVEYQGYDVTAGGHTWVCDGYDANDLMHMNWGWGGLDNGWYTVTNLNPGMGYDFTYNLGALIGIEPGVEVTALPPVVCSGSGSSLSITGGPVSATYTWTPSTGLNCNSCASPVATPAATTTYSVSIDSGGNIVNSKVTVYVDQPHELNYVLSDTQLCNGNTAVLTLVGVSGLSIGPASSASWHDSLTALLAPDTTTTYLVAAQTSVCGTADSANITVHVSPHTPVSFNLSSTTICYASYATLSYTGLSNVVATPSGNSYSGGTNTLVLNPYNTTSFSVSGLTSCGSVYTDTFTITVTDSTGALTYTLSKPTMCRGDTAILNVLNASNVQITPAGLVTSLGNSSYLLTPDSNTTFYITGYNASCGGQASAQVNVNVIQPGSLNYSVADQDICAGGYETIYLNGVTGNVHSNPSLYFYFSDSTDAYAYFVADTTETYAVSASTICGTSGSSNVNVTVLPTVAYNLQLATVCRGDSTLFTVSGLTGINIYPGAGFSMIDSDNYEFSPPVTTYYKLDGYDCNGNYNFYPFTIHVAQPGILNYTLPDSNLCSSFGAELFLNGVINPQINPSSDLYMTDASDYYTYLYPASTTNYTVTAESVCGGMVSTSFFVHVFPHAGYVLGAGSVCPGGSTTLSITGLSNATISPSNTVTWLNDSVAELSPASITQYQLNGVNCTGSEQQYSILVGVLQDTNVIYSVDSEICSGNQSYLSISGASEIVISPAVNLTYTDSFDAYSYLMPTVTTTYTMSSISECTGRHDTGVFTIYLVEDPSYTLSAQAVCNNDSVLVESMGLDNMAISPNTNVSYFNGNEAYLYPDTTTTFTISGNSSCTHSPYTQSFTITADSLPSGSGLNISLSHDTLFASGASAYQWRLNGSAIRGANMQFIVPSGAGVYTVVLGYERGCQAISNAFEFTGTEDLTENTGYKVYPNPTANGWTLQTNIPVAGSTCEIFDNEGRMVYSAAINSRKYIIDVYLSPGIYLMKILNAGQTGFIAKLVKL